MKEIKSESIESVIKEALKKYDTGRLKYGPLNLDTERRDFIHEAEQELLDCINYCVFQILRLRSLRGCQGIKTHCFTGTV